MSEMAKKARADMRAKARRLTSADPHQKVDASDWTPPEALNAGRKIYDQSKAKSATAKVYKHGGKIQGDRGPRRLDKMPRGGFKHGGATHLSEKHREKMPSKDFAFAGKGKGPKGKGAGAYPIEDKGHAESALARGKANLSPAKDAELKNKIKHKFPDMKVAKARGGEIRSGNRHVGGDGFYEGTRPTGGRIARARGGALNAPRYGLDKDGFKEEYGEGSPVKKIPKNFVNEGRKIIDSIKEAPREGRASGGRTKKGKTNIIINVGQQGPGNLPPMPPPAAVTPPPAAMMPPKPPMPPPGPPGGPGGPPIPPGGPGASLPPAMGRKRGGMVRMKAGAGSGLGRLEKKRAYGEHM